MTEPTTAAGPDSIEYRVAVQIARSRFGPGVDAGGRHNPLPSEWRLARQIVEDVRAEARTQDGSALRSVAWNLADSFPPSTPPALDETEIYVDRNLVVQAFAQTMERDGYQVWWGEDESEPDWPVLYVDTDEGQVSWHIPKAERLYEPPIRPEHGAQKWDGHTTPEKFDRLRARLQEQDR